MGLILDRVKALLHIHNQTRKQRNKNEVGIKLNPTSSYQKNSDKMVSGVFLFGGQCEIKLGVRINVVRFLLRRRAVIIKLSADGSLLRAGVSTAFHKHYSRTRLMFGKAAVCYFITVCLLFYGEHNNLPRIIIATEQLF